MNIENDIQERAINTIRFLSADAIQKANSGHPGLPMGVASVAYTIWTRHLKFNPTNPYWSDRDRFVLSGGHGSMLLYSLLYLSGYDLSLDELQNFRQWGSKTPGHPEYGLTPGVEVTTGPLGQGFANGVGMAITEAHLSSTFNKPHYEIVNHFVYAIVTDGDLMEGVSSEAASLAGHLKLGKLIYLYDDNRITIDGNTDITFTEDRVVRFISYGWHVIKNIDGNNVEEIDIAIQEAKLDPRPSLIVCQTQIGYGLPNRQNTSKAHGEPPGEDELIGAKRKLNWPEDAWFFVPDDVLKHFRELKDHGSVLESKWNELFEKYREAYPELAQEYERRYRGDLPENWVVGLPEFPADNKGLATRVSSGIILNAIAEKIPELVGGSADLTPSNKTWIEGSESFQFTTPFGRNIHFGVREHGMASIVNGMAVHGGVIPYAGTFLVFSDYMRPAIRLSALSNYPSIWVFTHDSIGLGEDGPTHQPIEQIAALRAIPNLVVLRPADANEVTEAWKIAIQRRHAPTSIILSRQNLPTIDRNIYGSVEGVQFGAYILADIGSSEPEIILMASGSEVSIILEAGIKLVEKGMSVRLVSFPSWELFSLQSNDYKEFVLPRRILPRISVEAGVAQGWERWIGDNGVAISINKFGASAPYRELYDNYGLTVDNVIATASSLFS